MITIMTRRFIQHISDIPHRKRHFAAGEHIVEMDDPVDRYFVVAAGLVHLFRMQHDGGMVILQRAGVGAVVAEASLFSDSYHCSVMAVTPTNLLIYPRAAVRQLLDDDPAVARALCVHMADEVRHARRRAEILALRKVSARLEAWLTWNHGVLPDRGAWHHVADEIGISKEALYRELAKRRKAKE